MPCPLQSVLWALLCWLGYLTRWCWSFGSNLYQGMTTCDTTLPICNPNAGLQPRYSAENIINTCRHEILQQASFVNSILRTEHREGDVVATKGVNLTPGASTKLPVGPCCSKYNKEGSRGNDACEPDSWTRNKTNQLEGMTCQLAHSSRAL